MRTAAAAKKRARWWIPPPVVEWFEGKTELPIMTLIVPLCALIDDYWAAWVEVHPDAVKPADWPDWQYTAEQLRYARTFLTRSHPEWYWPGGRRPSRRR